MIFKCKICGGTLDVKQGEQVAVCEYCGVRQSIPSFIEPKTEKIYNRANNYLMHNEFDKAENLFNQILFDDNSNADVYWNVLMCRYGVSYVKDPASGKYIPTCNRTLYTPIFNDENYKKALEYADEAQKELYVADAQIIDEIQKQILSVSKHEKPFDIFISYKETEINGMRTQDSIKAQELYDRLTAEGYKVFFSRITLEDKAGTEYEPYIYAALASSKVMLTISSTKENIEAVWVKNEWSRYLSFASKETDKTLIPLYFDMDSSDLPEEFAHLPAYDMSVNGFEQELIRGIKKLIPLPVMLFEQRKRRNKILKKIGIGAVSCAIIGLICSIPWFMKLPDYNAAMQLYYDKNYPEATWAFDQLGGYRDSKEMQDKCEKSWRNSLANVVLDDYMGRITRGSCYINTDGSVKNVPNKGTFKQLPEVNEHGKIVSISVGYPEIYALYDDGFVDNIANNNLSETAIWNNIVQISDQFNSTNIALTSEGKLIYGDLYNGIIEDTDDTWISEISEWKNIVSFDCYIYRLNGRTYHSAIIGVKADGTVCIVTDEKDKLLIDYNEIKKFKNVALARIVINQTDNSNTNIQPYIYALTKDGKVQYYYNGKFIEEKNDNSMNIVSILPDYDGYYNNLNAYKLLQNGKFYKADELLLNDIIYIQDNYAITRTGKAYDINSLTNSYYSNNNADIYVPVYDEWIERMN